MRNRMRNQRTNKQNLQLLRLTSLSPGLHGICGATTQRHRIANLGLILLGHQNTPFLRSGETPIYVEKPFLFWVIFMFCFVGWVWLMTCVFPVVRFDDLCFSILLLRGSLQRVSTCGCPKWKDSKIMALADPQPPKKKDGIPYTWLDTMKYQLISRNKLV